MNRTRFSEEVDVSTVQRKPAAKGAIKHAERRTTVVIQFI